MAKNWAYSVSRFNYSFTIELPPSKAFHTGLSGFELPESEILETGKEQFAGLMAMLKKLNNDITRQNS